MQLFYELEVEFATSGAWSHVQLGNRTSHNLCPLSLSVLWSGLWCAIVILFVLV